MESLSQRDWLKLFGFLQSLHVPRELPEFRKYIAAALPDLIASEVTGYNEINSRTRQNFIVVSPEEGVHFPESHRIFEEHIQEHPLIGYTAKTRDSRVLKISDFLSDAQYERLGLYQDFYRRIGTKYQMAVALSIRRPILVGIALNRLRPDFTERERTLLTVLRPHLMQAYENALTWSRMVEVSAVAHRALDNFHASVITLREDGGMVSLPSSAERLLEKYFDRRPKSLRLPDLLRDWLKAQVSSPLRSRGPFQIMRGHERLTVRATREEGRIVLLLAEKNSSQSMAPSVDLLLDSGLTRREAEVLSWVAHGRTNLEIAALLTMSPRTVQKHLERVFQKLGVESRTAAAARLWEILNSAEK